MYKQFSTYAYSKHKAIKPNLYKEIPSKNALSDNSKGYDIESKERMSLMYTPNHIG